MRIFSVAHASAAVVIIPHPLGLAAGVFVLVSLICLSRRRDPELRTA